MASQFVYGRSIRSRVGRSSAFFHQRIFGASHRHKRVHTHLSLSLSLPLSYVWWFLSIFDWVLIRLIRSIRLVLLELDLVISSSAWDKVASDPSAVNFRMWNVYVLASVGQAAPAAPFLTPFKPIFHPNPTRKKGRYTHSSLSNYNILLLLLSSVAYGTNCCCCQRLSAVGCRLSVLPNPEKFDWSLKGLKAQPTTKLAFVLLPALSSFVRIPFASSCEFEYLILFYCSL